MGHSCCHQEEQGGKDHQKRRPDLLLWGSLVVILCGYLLWTFLGEQGIGSENLKQFSHSVFDIVNKMYWGVLLGIVTVGLLGKVPREFIISLLGKGSTFRGILRAAGAGVLLDLCSHGILMVGMKLYERGASLGQTMAFLVASPWNSFSLTLILIALIGLPWTLAFILLSLVIAILTGIVFEWLTRKGHLPENPNSAALPQDFRFWPETKRGLANTHFDATFFREALIGGLQGSKMVLRWIFFGVVLAALIRTFVPPDQFEALFGPTMAGLGLTLVFATILEVCSEGSIPVAADIAVRAKAPGNSFAFLMSGVATDYTEIMALKETTRRWKIALFLPLITLPQVIVIAYLINSFAT